MEGTINAVEDSHMAQAEKSAAHSPGTSQNGEKNVVNLNSLILHRDRTKPPRSFSAIAGAAIAILAIILGVAFFIAAGMIALIIWIASKR